MPSTKSSTEGAATTVRLLITKERSQRAHQAALVVGVALGQGTHEGCPYAFLKTFKRIIDDETVPEDIPFAVPYDDLENQKIKISPKVKSIRGKLNVPRERFHLRGRSTYLWAGLQFH